MSASRTALRTAYRTALRAASIRVGRLPSAVRSRTELRPRASFYPRLGQRRVGDNPPYPRHGESRARPTLIASLWPLCPQVLGYAPYPHVTVPTCPLEGSAFAGRDGCPQPSVRRETCAPPGRFYPRSGQRSSPILFSIGSTAGWGQPALPQDINPPYPRHYAQRKTRDRKIS